ncbi:MAG: methyltransferase domain-containing protein [Thermoguttaceae bacterium]
MQLLGNLAERCRLAELMDQPDLEPDLHRQALQGLATLNLLSRSVGIVWPRIFRLARQLGRPVRILDVATGGGDVPLGIWRRAQKSRVQVDILGIDISLCALEVAEVRAARTEAAVRFAQLDALCDELPGDHDIVICSLFLHHLDERDATALLGRMAAVARHIVLVNDLVRSPAGLTLVAAASRLFTRSPVVWTDASRSVRAAFTVCELRELARWAGMRDIRLTRHWFCRMLLEWSRR